MKKDLKSLTNQELLKKSKTFKKYVGFFLVLILVILIVSIISIIKIGLSTFTFLSLVFLGIFLIYWAEYNKIKQEIKSRNLD